MVSTPLKNISQLGLFFPIYGKIKNVPNHQPVIGVINQLRWFISPTAPSSTNIPRFDQPHIPRPPSPGMRSPGNWHKSWEKTTAKTWKQGSCQQRWDKPQVFTQKNTENR